MEWIIGITVVCVVLYFMSRGGSEKRSADIADFIDEGRTYTQEEAVQTIERFLFALGDTEGRGYSTYRKEISRTFPRLVKALQKEYRNGLKEYKSEIADIKAFCKKDIDRVMADSNLDPEEKEEEIAELKEDCEEELKDFEKGVAWYENQISTLENNPKQVLKKILSLIKSDHKQGLPANELDDTHYLYDLIKEVPY